MNYNQEVLNLQGKLNDFKLSFEIKNQDTVADILQLTHLVLGSSIPDNYNLCLAAICHVADRWSLLDDFNKQLLRDCIAKSRVFLYEDMISEKAVSISMATQYAKDFYTIEKTGTTLTRDQKSVFDLFMQKGRIVVSAPTSFGKTRLLEEILIAKQYRVSVIVFPTLALLAEQYKRLKNRDELSGHHISTSSKISIEDNLKYILMLTPERLSLFLGIESNKNVKFDFFCVDEIYKADQLQDGARKYFFADVMYRLPKYNPDADFYLIGPYLASFSARYLQKFNATFIKFKSEVVQKDYFDLAALKKIDGFKGVTKTAPKKDRITKTLQQLESTSDAKSLVFCKDKRNTELVAEYVVNLHKDSRNEKNDELADYIADSISPHWNLVNYVRSGVAYHNGNIPRHIQELIVDAFDGKGGEINTLACTTTLIEGVNTNAKNIIFFDSMVAKDPIDPFTLKNIEGRAGRLTRHFLGKIYYLDPLLEVDNGEDKGDKDVELEFFGDIKPTMESAVQLESEDLTDDGRAVLGNIFEQAKANRVPVELLKSNKFISVKRQIDLINYLRAKQPSRLDLNEYQTLRWVLLSTHNFLFNERDVINPDTSLEGYYIPKSINYILRPRSLKQLIGENIKWNKENRPNEKINKVISDTIKFYTRYIEYAWPRYLTAFDRIYNFVQFERSQPSVSFDILIAKLEYGSTEPHQILLREAGVPFEIIQKVKDIFQHCKTPEEMYNTSTKSVDAIKRRLSSIEYRVLQFYI